MTADITADQGGGEPAPGGFLPRQRRRLQTIGTLVLVALAPVLVLATALVLGPLTVTPTGPWLNLVLLADLIYALVVAALVLARIARMIAARRSRSAGSQLHLRLSALFAGIALVPTVMVAVFAVITINIGLEGWFSDRVRNVVGTSLAAAEAYQAEQAENLVEDGQNVARFLDMQLRANPFLSEGALRQLLTEAQAGVQRGLRVAFIIDGAGTLRLRGERSYLFDFIRPSAEDLARAAEGEIVLIRDWSENEFRALVPLEGRADRLLYIARAVDGDLLSLLDETQATIQLYSQLERERGRVILNFGLIYLGFAVILILAATWLGMWLAERLSRPVGRLAGAAEAVGAGDLEVQVPEERGDDEIATMGRVFNQMTRQLKRQREALLTNTRQIEERRRLFDSVLSSVTAGVIGLDAEGRVQFVNRAAEALTQIDAASVQGRQLAEVVPEFDPLLVRLRAGEGYLGGRVQDELRLSRAGKLETLLLRMAERRTAAGLLEGYVVAFDDVSELVSAQRMAAWGDVARRIAHEIKNPLTPIQLSAGRISRKFGRQLSEEEAKSLGELTDVIIRQTDDLRRIVDEFSRFARMPEPDRRPCDLGQILRDAVTLQEARMETVAIALDMPAEPVVLDIDATMLGQAFTNLIKNAGEAIETLMKNGDQPDDFEPRIAVALRVDASRVTVTIIDNGIGLPDDPSRLFEPYVTTRDEGTGLGLPIVKKIIEEHGGTLSLEPAPARAGAETGARHRGAKAVIRLPMLDAGRGRGEQIDGRMADRRKQDRRKQDRRGQERRGQAQPVPGARANDSVED